MSQIENYLNSTSPISRLVNQNKPLKDVKNSIHDKINMMSHRIQNYSGDKNQAVSNYTQLKAASIVYKIPELSPPEINFEVSDKVKQKITNIKSQIVTKLPIIKSSNYNTNKLDVSTHHRTVVKELQQWLRVKLQDPPTTLQDSIQYKNMIMGIGMKQVIRIIGTRCTEQANMISEVWELTWGICRQIILYLSKRAKKCEDILAEEIDFLKIFYDRKIKQYESTHQYLSAQYLKFKEKSQTLSKQIIQIRRKNKELKINFMVMEDMKEKMRKQFENILQENLSLHLSNPNSSSKKKTDWARRIYMKMNLNSGKKDCSFQKYMKNMLRENDMMPDVEELGEFQLRQNLNKFKEEQEMRMNQMALNLENQFKKQTNQTQTQIKKYSQVCQNTDEIEIEDFGINTEVKQCEQISINTIQSCIESKKMKSMNKNQKNSLRTPLKNNRQKIRTINIQENSLISRQQSNQGQKKQFNQPTIQTVDASIQTEQINADKQILSSVIDYNQTEDIQKLDILKEENKQCLSEAYSETQEIDEIKEYENSQKKIFHQKSNHNRNHEEKENIMQNEQKYNLQSSINCNGIRQENNNDENNGISGKIVRSIAIIEGIGSYEEQANISLLKKQINQIQKYYQIQLKKKQDLLQEKAQQIEELKKKFEQVDVMREFEMGLKKQVENQRKTDHTHLSHSKAKINELNTISQRSSKKSNLAHKVSHKDILNVIQDMKENIQTSQKLPPVPLPEIYFEEEEKQNNGYFHSQKHLLKFHELILQYVENMIEQMERNKPTFIQLPESNMELYKEILEEINKDPRQGTEKHAKLIIEKTIPFVLKDLSKEINQGIKLGKLDELKAHFSTLPNFILTRFNRNFGVKKVAMKHLKDFLVSLKRIQKSTHNYSIIWYFMRNFETNKQSPDLLFFYLFLTTVYNSLNKVLIPEDISNIQTLAKEHLCSDGTFLASIKWNPNSKQGDQNTLVTHYKSIIIHFNEFKDAKYADLDFIFRCLTKKQPTIPLSVFFQFFTLFSNDWSWHQKIIEQVSCVLQYQKDSEKGINKNIFHKIVRNCNILSFQKLESLLNGLYQNQEMMEEVSEQKYMEIGDSCELMQNLVISLLAYQTDSSIMAEKQAQFIQKYILCSQIERSMKDLIGPLCSFETKNTQILLYKRKTDSQ